MPITYGLNSIGVPGTYVFENSYGGIPQSIASHDDCYLLVHSTSAALKATPTFVQSPADFSNVFGATLSQNSVQLYFDQRPSTGLWVIAVQARESRTLTIPTVTVGAVYSVTVQGNVLPYTAVTGDTQATILAALATQINALVPDRATLIGNILRYTTGTTIAATANITLGTATTASAYPTVGDVLDTATRVFVGDMPLGFICAPEFFQSYTNASDLAALANGLEAIASDSKVLMFVLADCSLAASTGNVLQVLTERSSINSPKGRMAYYYPYVKNLNGTNVPCSTAIAGLASKIYRNVGFQQVPAGDPYPLVGVTGLSADINDRIQKQLNPKGVNCIRKRYGGFYVWGARAATSNAFYTFMNVGVIMNVVDRTLDSALQSLVFQSVDGIGVLFQRITATCTGACERLRVGGALYGATSGDAYKVICDATNNPAVDLDNGAIAVDVFVKPSPTAEVIAIRVFRTALGTSFTEETAYKQDVNAPDAQGTGSGGADQGTTGGNS